MGNTPFKMSGFSGFGSPMRDEKKMTAAQMQAASLAAAEKKPAIEVSGGKKTVQGSFIQYPGKAERGGGSTIAGSSQEHSKLRVKEKNRTLSSSERGQLETLNLKTGKAYQEMQSKKPGQHTAKKAVAIDAKVKNPVKKAGGLKHFTLNERP